MIKIENAEVRKEGAYDLTSVTIPFDKNFPLLGVNFDLDSATIEVNGKQLIVDHLFISDNGEWIVMMCMPKHGGVRPGSGRPETNRKIAVSVRISQDAYDILTTKRNKSEFIDTLIKKYGKEEE